MSNKSIGISHNLSILAVVISKSKRFYGIKPRDIIVSEPCEIQFVIANIGNKAFPGGKINTLHIRHVTEENLVYNFDIDIPKISPQNVHMTKRSSLVPITNGTAWIHLTIKSKDNKPINYYQVSKTGVQNILLGQIEWRDYFHVASQHEIHQRYTNYLLLILTTLTASLFIINIILLLRGNI